jgi:large subunit ribosomal protein L20
MVRVKRGNIASQRRKKYLKLAKGYVGSNSRLSTMAMEQIVQSLNFAYIGRKLKKRNFRRIWIYRINVATRARKNIYSKFIGCLRNLNILLDRKILAFLAFNDLSSFNAIERKSRVSPIFLSRNNSYDAENKIIQINTKELVDA